MVSGSIFLWTPQFCSLWVYHAQGMDISWVLLTSTWSAVSFCMVWGRRFIPICVSQLGWYCGHCGTLANAKSFCGFCSLVSWCWCGGIFEVHSSDLVVVVQCQSLAKKPSKRLAKESEGVDDCWPLCWGWLHGYWKQIESEFWMAKIAYH